MIERMDDARRLLAEQNMGLVLTMIGKLQLHYDIDDLKCVGNVGLCKAAASWQPGRGTAFTTYACHLICNELINYVSKNSRRGGVQHLPLDDCQSLRAEGDAFERAESRELARNVLRRLGEILDEDEEETARLFLAGATTAEAAKALGLSVSTIAKNRRRIGRKIENWINGKKEKPEEI